LQGAKLISFKYHGGDNQRFYVEQAEKGFYAIKNKKSGLYLDVPGSSLSNSEQIIQWSFHGGPNQLFDIGETAEWFGEPGILEVTNDVAVRCKHSKKVLDVQGGSKTNSTQII